MKKIKNFTIFTNENHHGNWRDSAKLKGINRKTGIFDEASDLEEFEKNCDDSFDTLFDKAFADHTLFGGDFSEYMDAREQQMSDKRLSIAYKELEAAYNKFKKIMISDLEDAQDNYGHD